MAALPVEPLVRPEPLLELENVDAGYAAFRALFGVSMVVPEGSAIALLGSNGSGKTSVARVISGLITPTAGRLRFAGEDVTGLSAWRLSRLGIAHAPEGRSVFASLTVEENLVLGFRQSLGRDGVAGGLERAYERFPALAGRRRQNAGTLSGGEQRMLSLARVFADPPRLLVVDELSLGLAPAAVDSVFDALEDIRGRGTTLVVIEQHVDRALALADLVVLLVKGRVVFRGSAAEVGEEVERLLPGEPA
ncbi:MAG: ABC transporter ATP-binding protein [Acidimicrobiia bacterium]|nr:ABC transporter ATP-binding protein [Acidimicrobiia bacterium]